MDYAKRADEMLPEVVPVENTTKDNTIYNHYLWVNRPIPASNHESDIPIASTTHSPSHSDKESMTIGPKRSHRMSPTNFTLLVALGVFLFTSLALSTGLGIPLAQCRNTSNPNDYAALQPLNVNLVKTSGLCSKNDMPIRNATFTVGDSHFDLYCGKKFTPGLRAYDSISRNGIANGTIRNIISIISYSVSDCITACVSMNNLAMAGSSPHLPCQSVTFLAGMGAAVADLRGNCFLKNSTVNNLNEAIPDDHAVSAEVASLRTAN